MSRLLELWRWLTLRDYDDALKDAQRRATFERGD
jgi:hypothetical protein